MREFRLFKHRSGAFEVLPVGWSASALVLSLFWAIGNGLFWRFAGYMLPGILSMATGMFLLDVQRYETLGTVLVYVAVLYNIGFILYFATVAFKWRGERLVDKGYEQIATMYGRSGHDALKRWALSNHADPGATAPELSQ